MTHPTSNHRRPGTFLLKLAQLVFDEAVVASVVEPTIADLQAETRAASGHRLSAIRARLRGYAAFWVLVALAPVTAHTWPVEQRGTRGLVTRSGGLSIWLVLAAILGFTSPAMTPWTALVLVGGTIFAVAIHYWYSRHPSVIAARNGEGRPEINFSRVPVGGNIGGLIFMAGSMGILVAGLPGWRWFFGAAVIGGALTAALVWAWHVVRPNHGLPENLIHLR